MIYNRCEYCISFKTLGVTDVSATDDDCISVKIYIHAQTGLINWKAKVEVTGNQPIIVPIYTYIYIMFSLLIFGYL